MEINNKFFIEDLKKAINSGIESDYDWNGEDEIRVEKFNEETAFNNTIKVIEEFFHCKIVLNKSDII